MNNKKKIIEPVNLNAQTITEQNLFTGRIESVQDREVNNKLFTMYSKLIQPVKSIEDRVGEIESLFAEENNMYDFYNTFFLRKGIKIGVICCILLVAACIFDLQDFIFDKLSWYYDSIENVMEMLNLPYDGIITIIFGLVYIFLPFFLVPTAIGFIIGFIEKTVRKSKNEKRKKYIFERTEVLKQEINDMTKNIAPTVQYVPPKYRTSDALSYFVSAYQNSQIDDLKEAVNSYTEYQRHQELVGTFHNICSTLANVEYIQLETLNQLR